MLVCASASPGLCSSAFCRRHKNTELSLFLLGFVYVATILVRLFQSRTANQCFRRLGSARKQTLPAVVFEVAGPLYTCIDTRTHTHTTRKHKRVAARKASDYGFSGRLVAIPLTSCREDLSCNAE